MALPSDSELRDMLRTAGLRATAARVAVLRLLHGIEAPTSHPEVHAALSNEGWDRATLYRNLNDLTDKGLLRKSDLGDHLWRFELARTPLAPRPEHPHFLCTVCGDVTCLPDLVLPDMPNAPKSVQMGVVDIQFRGTCDDCAP